MQLFATITRVISKHIKNICVQRTSEKGYGNIRWGHITATIDGLTEGYYYKNDEVGDFTFVIGRTMHIDQLKEDYWGFKEDPIRVLIYFDDDSGVTADFFISKNGKFFIAFTSHFESVYPMQVFCETDD